MAKPRKKPKGPSVQHLFNRPAGPRDYRPFRENWRRQYLMKLLLVELAPFFNIEILSVAILCSHPHIVARVNPHLPHRREVIRRWRQRYGGKHREPDWDDSDVVRKMAERMSDFSMFMKDFDQAVAEWMNSTEPGRIGHFWAGRFGNVTLGDISMIWRGMRYVECNAPVAHLCDLPEQYRFCTFAMIAGGAGKHPNRDAWFGALRAALQALHGPEVRDWPGSRLLEYFRSDCIRYIAWKRGRNDGGRRQHVDCDDDRILERGGILGCDEHTVLQMAATCDHEPHRAGNRKLTVTTLGNGERYITSRRPRMLG